MGYDCVDTEWAMAVLKRRSNPCHFPKSWSSQAYSFEGKSPDWWCMTAHSCCEPSVSQVHQPGKDEATHIVYTLESLFLCVWNGFSALFGWFACDISYRNTVDAAHQWEHVLHAWSGCCIIKAMCSAAVMQTVWLRQADTSQRSIFTSECAFHARTIIIITDTAGLLLPTIKCLWENCTNSGLGKIEFVARILSFAV